MRGLERHSIHDPRLAFGPGEGVNTRCHRLPRHRRPRNASRPAPWRDRSLFSSSLGAAELLARSVCAATGQRAHRSDDARRRCAEHGPDRGRAAGSFDHDARCVDGVQRGDDPRRAGDGLDPVPACGDAGQSQRRARHGARRRHRGSHRAGDRHAGLCRPGALDGRRAGHRRPRQRRSGHALEPARGARARRALRRGRHRVRHDQGDAQRRRRGAQYPALRPDGLRRHE
jgi:hypothetical protein